MIVPGSANVPAMASLGRRLLPAPRSCALYCCLVPDSDPDRAFFFSYAFLLFYFLAFLPISLIAHHVRSSPFPFRPAPLNATGTALARPALLCSPICLVSCSYDHLVYFSPCLHLPFCSFLVAQPIPSLVPLPLSASSDPPACASLRQGLPLAFLLRRTRGLISIHYAAGVPRASPATPLRDSSS
jgi:hypothetical protein